MTFTTFVVKRYGSGEEYEFELDTEFALTKEIKEKLVPLTGLPVSDQDLVYDGRIMKDDNTLLEGSLHNDMNRVILVCKSQKIPKESLDTPADWKFEDNPLFKPMNRYLEDHYSTEDMGKLAYHMIQYARQVSSKVSLDHLEMVAETNLERYEHFLEDRRKHYYELFEKCWYLDRKLRLRDSRRSASEKARLAARRALAQQQARAEMLARHRGQAQAQAQAQAAALAASAVTFTTK